MFRKIDVLEKQCDIESFLSLKNVSFEQTILKLPQLPKSTVMHQRTVLTTAYSQQVSTAFLYDNFFGRLSEAQF